MVDNRITRARMRHHFTYNAWKYALLVALAVFGWDLIYNMTAYRPPANKKLDIYILAPSADVERMSADLNAELRAAFPDQEAFNFLAIALGSGDQEDPYAQMQFSTYVSAHEGDVFLMPWSRFRQYGGAEGGLFLPLDEFVASGTLELAGIDTSAGRLPSPDGGSALYGVPAATQKGLEQYRVDSSDMLWSVAAYSRNQENAVRLVSWLMKRFDESVSKSK